MKLPMFRYALVGILNTGIHAFALFILSNILGVSLSVSNLSAFLCAATSSYFFNSHFTFAKQPNCRGYALFVLMNGFLAYSVGYAGEITAASVYIVFVIFSTVSFVFGYFLSKKWIFKK